MRNSTFVVSLALGLSAAAASAGVVMEYEIKSGKDKPMTGAVYAENDRLRMETGDVSIIYRADKELVWMLDRNGKSYTEMTKADLEAMAKQMAEAMKALESMPPEMKAKMQGMMGGGAPDTEPETIKKLGKSETINGFPCEAYEVSKGGKVVRTAWVTPFKKFELKAADFEVFARMAEFWKQAGGPFAKNVDKTFLGNYSDEEKPGTLPGVPIRTVQGDTTHEIKKVAHESIPADKFEVPAGLKKQQMKAGR